MGVCSGRVRCLHRTALRLVRTGVRQGGRHPQRRVTGRRQPWMSTPAKAGLRDRGTRNAAEVGGFGGHRPWGISSESLLGRRGPGPAASRGRETRHWAPPYAQTARMAVRRRAIRCIRGRPRRVSTSMRCGRGAVCVLRGARACPERAGRSAVAILTYLLTAYHGSDNRLIIIRATFLGFFPCQGFFSCCFSWSVNDRAPRPSRADGCEPSI